ncbi:hypothetical protein MPTK1_8g00920 [Marchantia polymorpha subsp. ruderalis]|uniref:Uncharacterized protein n=1 Tax=Marchantia polymorpha TaxID=3197 RepID=A0A2R6WRF3_MARPO|nr:hypothetical protein MARPO_0064s0105 [Marchantia polymorpha]BBN18242.1 hypothetical protein Mp_8g00920 [Marchantia polymorpha subsp. ruderalis]|eukprot:PTQ36431.1 hypothetical protein MARPO_0064s0105 [Marchantia polymorpha]
MNSLQSEASPALVKAKLDDEGFESPKLVNSYASFRSDPYSSFRSEYSYTYADCETEFLHRPRRADNYYGIRQEYLRSYTFTREQPPSSKPEKFKEHVKRLKAVAWAILCCKYKPGQAKALREKLSSRSARFFHGSSDFLKSSSCRFTVPSCIRSSIEVA